MLAEKYVLKSYIISILIEKMDRLKLSSEKKKVLRNLRNVENMRTTVGTFMLSSMRSSPWISPELSVDKSTVVQKINSSRNLHSPPKNTQKLQPR